MKETKESELWMRKSVMMQLESMRTEENKERGKEGREEPESVPQEMNMSIEMNY